MVELADLQLDHFQDLQLEASRAVQVTLVVVELQVAQFVRLAESLVVVIPAPHLVQM